MLSDILNHNKLGSIFICIMMTFAVGPVTVGDSVESNANPLRILRESRANAV